MSLGYRKCLQYSMHIWDLKGGYWNDGHNKVLQR